MATKVSNPSGKSPSRSDERKKQATHPTCPKCTRRMTVKQVSPVLFAATVDDVIYGCEDCGTEVKRTVKRA
jgi:hypothetical protein